MAKKTKAEGWGGAPGVIDERLKVHIILDRSGSMSSCHSDTLGGVNAYLATLKAEEKVWLTLFDGISIDTIWNGVDPTEEELTAEEFVPRGNTPLYDAIGKSIDKITGTKVALVIVTDGQENASREFSAEIVKKLLEERQAKGWLVVYLGANQDAFVEGGRIGTVSANTMGFDTANTASVFTSAARATRAYGVRGMSSDAAFTDEEREKALPGWSEK